MTMQPTHSPKPKIFGEGYGKHVADNLKLMQRFFWLGWKILANTFVPSAFYERAHWEVIDLYHRMRGFRHGTDNEKRCDECGGEIMSADDVRNLREANKVIKELRAEIANHTCVEPVYPDRAGGELHSGDSDSE